jgi:hypothetical protein
MAKMDPRKMAPGYTNEEHPEIVDIRAMPPQPKTLKPGQVPENLIKQYFEEVRDTRSFDGGVIYYIITEC